jgi:DMSO/TMAO reductase YedYZ molybdopterin-dependent catalytic subunit
VIPLSSRFPFLAVVGVTLTALLGQATASQAAPPPGPVPARVAGSVTISGDVRTELTLTQEELRACPSRTETVTFEGPSGPQQQSFLGCPLESLIIAAQPLVDEAAKHPYLTLGVVATGADGYSAALSWGEVASAVAPRPALIAWSEDGKPLDRPRLVIPGDLNGSRYVSALTDLWVVQLTP